MRKQIVMRLTAFVLLTVTLHCSAAGFTQNKITLKEQNAPLEKVLKSIKKQSGFALIYTKQMLEKASLVTIDVNGVSLAEALDACLSLQPLEYTIVNETIVLKAKNELPKPNLAPDNDVTGRVTNSAGEPLAGASVIVKRTGKGDIADANGNFKLKNVNADDILEISFTGYKTQSAKVAGATVLALVLDVAVDELDRAVVQAYGKTTQRLATGNIAKVTAAEIERQPVMNPMIALQGKVAGLDVSQTNGYATAPVKIELRGRNAVNNSFTSDPLYIIDGVPLIVLEISNNSNYASGSRGFLQSGNPGPAGGQSPLFNINPNDIESIEVLKDADATAIYGSRGANGVILITTKKGKGGRTDFDLNIQHGFTVVTRYYDLLNTPQYLAMRREALRNDGDVPTIPKGDFDLLLWDTTRYTDWQKVLYGGTGRTISAQASISGGNDQTNFRLSGGYNRQSNILSVSGADQRSSLAANLNHASTNRKLTISFSAAYSATESDMISFPAAALNIPPNAPPILDSTGNLNYSEWGSYPSLARNAFRFNSLKQPYSSKTNFLNGNLTVNYEILKRLNLSTSFGVNTAKANQETFNPIAAQDPMSLPTGSALFNDNNNSNWNLEPQLSYNVFIGRGKIDAQVGASLQKTITSALSLSGSGYTSDILLKNISSAPIRSGGYSKGEYRYAALFGRVNYNYLNRYILNVAVRRDGSSRFGDGRQFGNFASVGAAWIISEESWFKMFTKAVSFAKLRGSYGTTGADGVGDYAYLTRWTADGTDPYRGISSLIPVQHANPNFQWQVNKKLEGAIDLGLFKDRLFIGAAYYRNRCGNQLIDFPIPMYSGFSSVVANSPALVQNGGWEFVSRVKIFSTRFFSWSANFNVGFNDNKLVSYPDFELSPYTEDYIVGKPLNIVKVLHYVGVDPLTGTYAYEDKDHDGLIKTASGQKINDTYVRNLSPDYLGGFGTDLNFRGLSLSLFFNFRKQIGKSALNNIPGNAGGVSNQPAELFGKQWQKPGDVATYSKFTAQNAVYNIFFRQRSDGSFSDASYVRLSNVALTYSLPTLWLEKASLRGASVFIHANNLFVITRYKGPDPETQNFGGLPPTRTLVAGLSFHF